MLADLSSEIVYPLFPIFVTVVLGAPVALLGLIEGIAEATASITKYPFGQAADYSGRRKPFVLGGYTLGALGKLVVALAPGGASPSPGAPPTGWARACARRRATTSSRRTRGPASRASPSGCTAAWTRSGAVLGPLAAILLLELHVPLRWIFALAVIPGLLSVLVIVLLVREHREAPQKRPSGSRCPGRPRSAGCWPARWSSPWATRATPSCCSGPRTSSAARSSTRPSARPCSTSCTTSCTPPGRYLSAASATGWGSTRWSSPATRCSPSCTLGFAAAGSVLALAGLFAVYGLYIAATEGTSKALIGRAIPTGQRASALGLYYTATGLAASPRAPSAACSGAPTARGRPSRSEPSGGRCGRAHVAGSGRVRRALEPAEAAPEDTQRDPT